MLVKKVAAGLGALAMVAALGACASGGQASTDTASAAADSTNTSGGASCGTVPYKAPSDPDGAFAALPKSTKQAYNGYSDPVRKSTWANWKPKQKKATVAISWTQPTNDFAATALKVLKADLQKDPAVGKVVALSGPATGDIPAQLQQYQSLVQQDPDLIVLNVSAGEPFVKPVAAAAKKGIPTVSVLTSVPSADAVTVVPNTYLTEAQVMAAQVKAIGGKGTMLAVHGIPSLSIDKDAADAFKAVLANCSEIDVVGSVTGNFVPSQAKSAVIKFLSTHPQQIDAVAAFGGMATGIISAFQQTGRSVPSVSEQAALKGMLGYWLKHRDSFKGADSGGGAEESAHLFSAVVSKMIAGDGIKVNAVTFAQPVIDASNLEKWADSKWSLDTPGTASGPGDYLHIDRTLAPLFNDSTR